MVRPASAERGLASSSAYVGWEEEGRRGVGVFSDLIAGLGGASDGGGGATSADVACSAVLVEEGNGSGGITNGDFIGNLSCNDWALSVTDEDDCLPLVLLAVVLLAVVEAEPESTMTALPMLTVLMTLSPSLIWPPSLIWRCTALPASRCV